MMLTWITKLIDLFAGASQISKFFSKCSIPDFPFAKIPVSELEFHTPSPLRDMPYIDHDLSLRSDCSMYLLCGGASVGKTRKTGSPSYNRLL